MKLLMAVSGAFFVLYVFAHMYGNLKIFGGVAEFDDYALHLRTMFTPFLPFYVEKGILADDPFRVLDATGVGKLVRMAVEDGRRVRPTLKVGICGEHGGEPKSVKLCHQLGLDYVSCSPFRVPIARLAAAQAALAAPQPAISHQPSAIS